MDIQEIVGQLSDKFGNKVNVDAITAHFKGMDTSKMSFNDIISKAKDANLLGDLDGDGDEEGLFEEIKGKIGSLFGK